MTPADGEFRPGEVVMAEQGEQTEGVQGAEPARKSRLDGVNQRLAALAKRRRVSFWVAVGQRFNEVDGGNQSVVLSVTLFTTVLPLIILSFGHANGFAANVNIGTLFDREAGLSGANSDAVRNAFSTANSLRSSWSVIGLAGFLVWGIPMAVSVAAIFAKAWRREMLGFGHRLWRGTLWFLLYMLTLTVRDRISYGGDYGLGTQILLLAASLVPIWVFWSATPALLVREGWRGGRFLLKAGLAGTAIQGILLPVGLRLAFPPMMSGLISFGPIGVAMAIITWCGVIGISWVVTACLGAVLWERSAPASTVVAVETDPVADPLVADQASPE
jgi:hypothetical protein